MDWNWFVVVLAYHFGVLKAGRNPKYRLSGDIKPLAYDISIVTDLDGFEFSGEVHIKILCLNATSTIYVHSAPSLKINTPKLEGEDSSCGLISISEVSHEKQYEYLIIELVNQLRPGREYLLKLAYSSKLQQNPAGYYITSYLDSATNMTKWVASTYFETALARSAFPCFDEPSMKAKFRIRLGHRNAYRSVSNMPLARAVPMETRKGWVWSEFEESAPMSTYLVGWMVGPLGCRESKSIGKVKLSVWARPDVLNHTSLALSAAPKFLKFYEDFFAIKYPLPKVDLLAIPDYPSDGMENWGLPTFREANLLYDVSRPSSEVENEILNTIAHELAHQWFGNLVTMKWWTDLWLKEGFATYLGALAMNHIYPNKNFLDEDSMEEAMDVLELDSLTSSHPISARVQTASDADEIFDAISYEKGSMVIRMMHHFLGSSFRKGLARYLRANQFSNADQDDLGAALTSQAHDDGVLPNDLSIKDIMDSWTLQTGYPILRVIRNYETGVVYVSQSRFFRGDKEAGDRSCWWFPLTYTHRSEANFDSLTPKHWLKCGQNRVELSDPSLGPSDWLIVNLKLTGLARVLYDTKNWDLLIQTLNSDSFGTINEINRGGLIDDVFQFAGRGDLPYETVIRLSRYLHRENSFVPLNRGMIALQTEFRLRFTRTPNYRILKNFMNKILNPLFRRFNLCTPSENNPGRINVLISKFACLYETEDCLEQTKVLYDKWVADENSIPLDLQPTVLSSAVRHGGDTAWTEVYQKFLKSTNPSESKDMIRALACTPNKRLLKRFLDWSLTEMYGIKKKEASRVFGEIIDCSPNGFDLSLDYLENNIERIYQYHQPTVTNLIHYIVLVGSHIIYPHELSRFQKFIEKNSKFLEGIKMVTQQSQERAALNVEWHGKYYNTVSELLSET